MNHIISCAQYDYFEIACMHHYKIKLILNSGETLIGIAHNVKIVKNDNSRKEILELRLESEKLVMVELRKIHTMQALQANPHFGKITIQ